MKFTTAFLVAFACSGALASEPGQPLDCSDWVFNEPGHSCTLWVPPNCTTVDPASPFCVPHLENLVLDNNGGQLATRILPTGASCCDQPGSCFPCSRFALIRYDGVAEQIIAYVDGRLNADGGNDGISGTQLDFDRSNGRLLVWLTSTGEGPPSPPYGNVRWVAAIGGFATTLEVVQTFTPQASLGFRVPYMPEGMPATDSFDTYWGPLTKPIDFTQAQPLECDYPASPPAVGDYLSVADPLPAPTSGTGRYYITAATYQGATRYGRKTTAGQMSGRDPALLPACAP
jgi:hypothetical protein